MSIVTNKIGIVLNEELRAYSYKGRSKGELGSFNIRLPGNISIGGSIPTLIVEKPGLDHIHSPNAETLIKLYHSLKSSEKGEFEEALLSYLSKEGGYQTVAYLIFFVLRRIGKMTEAIKLAKANLKGDPAQAYSNLLAMLSSVVMYEYSTFDGNQFEEIREILSDDDEYNFQLFERINSAELNFLKQELGEINPEINRDREKIVNLWVEKFGSPEIPSIINEVEEHFSGGDFNSAKFATATGRVRVLLVETLRKIAETLAAKNKDKLITKDTDDQAVFDYLRRKDFIEDSEKQSIQAVYAMASTKGTHSATGLKEYARITKNITYELILLVLTKAQGLESE